MSSAGPSADRPTNLLYLITCCRTGRRDTVPDVIVMRSSSSRMIRTILSAAFQNRTVSTDKMIRRGRRGVVPWVAAAGMASMLCSFVAVLTMGCPAVRGLGADRAEDAGRF
jgi:hypothetical protein